VLKEYSGSFEKYKLGLKGINTKDTTISLALSELYKMSDKIYEDIMLDIKELNELKDNIDLKDHLKALEESLNVVTVNNCFSLVKSDKVVESYANSNTIKELGNVFGPSLTEDGYTAHLVSTSMQVKEYVDKLDTNSIIDFNSKIANTITYLELTKEKILDGDGSLIVEPVTLTDIPPFTVVEVKDNVTGYLTLKEISTADSKLSPINALIKLYNVVQTSEANIISIMGSVDKLDTSVIEYTLTAVHDYITSTRDDSETTQDMETKSIELLYLLNDAVNNYNVAMVENNTKLSEVNSVINFLYLLKSIIEAIATASNIKGV